MIIKSACSTGKGWRGSQPNNVELLTNLGHVQPRDLRFSAGIVRRIWRCIVFLSLRGFMSSWLAINDYLPCIDLLIERCYQLDITYASICKELLVGKTTVRPSAGPLCLQSLPHAAWSRTLKMVSSLNSGLESVGVSLGPCHWWPLFLSKHCFLIAFFALRSFSLAQRMPLSSPLEAELYNSWLALPLLSID